MTGLYSILLSLLITALGQISGGTTSYAYNPRGTLQQETRTVQGLSYVTQYSYDTADQLTSIIYPSGRVVSYTRNTLGQVTEVATTQDGTTTTLASGIEYLPFGPSTGMTLGNGLTDSRDFDLDYRVSSIANAALDLSYSYDTRNNVTGIADNLDSARTQSFGYDALSRLNSALGDYGSLSYSYDGVGNRLSETDDGITTSYTYNPQSHRLLAVGSQAYGYDAGGNVTQKGSQALSYNQANRLSSVQQNGLELLSNLYNAAGQRVMKSAGSQATIYHYGPGGTLLAESDTAGEVQLERVYLNGQPLAQFTPADLVTTQPIEDELPVPLPVPVEDPIEPVPPLIQPTPVYPPAEPVVQCLPRGRGAFTFANRFGFFLPCIWNRFRPPVPVSPPFVRFPFLPPPPPPPAIPPEVPPTPVTPPPEENGRKLAYFHLDHLGTPQRLTDRVQTTVWDASYEPFGEVSLKRNRVEQPIRFPGQVADPETGTYQNGMREYDSATDRYGQFDTLGLAGGINGYIYANANPLTYIDPTGEAFFIPIVAGIAADYAYDQYIDPYVQDFIRDKFDCETQRMLAAAGMGIGVLRTIKNPLGIIAKKSLHKNSLDYVGETHVYRIKGPDGSTFKIGESARGTRVGDGASIRAEEQARRLTRETGDRYRTEIRKTFPDKASARDYETRVIERFRRMYGQDSLPGNRTNR